MLADYSASSGISTQNDLDRSQKDNTMKATSYTGGKVHYLLRFGSDLLCSSHRRFCGRIYAWTFRGNWSKIVLVSCFRFNLKSTQGPPSEWAVWYPTTEGLLKVLFYLLKLYLLKNLKEWGYWLAGQFNNVLQKRILRRESSQPF